MPKLKRDVVVADDGGELITLAAGTSSSQIKKSLFAQLAPAHFDGDLDDWRSDEAQQADKDFEAAKAAELAERAAAKVERSKATQLADAKARIDADQKLVQELEES